MKIVFLISLEKLPEAALIRDCFDSNCKTTPCGYALNGLEFWVASFQNIHGLLLQQTAWLTEFKPMLSRDYRKEALPYYGLWYKKSSEGYKSFFIWVFFIFLSHNTTKAFPALKKTYPKRGTSTPFKGIQCLPYTY